VKEIHQKRKKILFLSSWYPNKENPTLGNFVQKHAEAANIYNEVVVLALFSSSSSKSIEVIHNKNNNLNEILVYYPKKKTIFQLFNKAINLVNQYKAFVIGYKRALNLLNSIDIVHLNVTYPAGIWAWRIKQKYNIQYIITEHSNGFHLGGQHAYPPRILKLSKLILKKASVIMPVSEDLKNNLKKLCPHQHYEIISNVVDERIFQPEIHEKNKLTQFVHISTAHDPQKNVSGIIRVINKLRAKSENFQLHIISDGNTDYAKAIVKDLNLNDFVIFHSTKTTYEIADFLKKSDCLVLFSNYENFPCVIAESLMLGIPVISSSVNGIPEHISEWNGILVNKGNEDELEDALYHFIHGTRNFDSNRMRQYALKHFSYKEVGRAFDTIYTSVLNRKEC
jgi:glycosyltransferase involved in cell wall biosynthesis